MFCSHRKYRSQVRTEQYDGVDSGHVSHITENTYEFQHPPPGAPLSSSQAQTHQEQEYPQPLQGHDYPLLYTQDKTYNSLNQVISHDPSSQPSDSQLG